MCPPIYIYGRKVHPPAECARCRLLPRDTYMRTCTRRRLISREGRKLRAGTGGRTVAVCQRAKLTVHPDSRATLRNPIIAARRVFTLSLPLPLSLSLSVFLSFGDFPARCMVSRLYIHPEDRRLRTETNDRRFCYFLPMNTAIWYQFAERERKRG